VNLPHDELNILMKEEKSFFFVVLIEDVRRFLFYGKSVQFVPNRIQICNKSTHYLSAGSFRLIPLDKILFKCSQ